MFKPLTMQRITLKVLQEYAPLTALILADSGVFGPETSQLPEEILPHRPGDAYHKLFSSAETRLSKVKQRVSLPTPIKSLPLRGIELAELEQINQHLGELWNQFSKLEEQQHKAAEERRHLDSLSQSLEIFQSLDIDLSVLRNTREFLDLHVGTLPLIDLQRFEKAVSLAPYHFLKVFYKTQDTAYVMVAGPPKQASDTHQLLQTADFKTLVVPPEFSDRPQKIRQDLAQRQREVDSLSQQLAAEVSALGAHWAKDLSHYQAVLRLAAPYDQLVGLMRGGRSGLILIEGWIPSRDVAHLRHMLQTRLQHPFELSVRDPIESELSRVPTLMSHPRFFRPFEVLVRNFGIPRYDEIDPTLLFTASFILMFGMMFGDIGHGAVIVVAGWYFREKLGDFARMVIAVGMSSVLFGFLYGSVFGYEEILHALWVAPLSDPMLMLSVALVWGVSFILMACVLKLYNLLTAKRYKEAWFDNQGLAGILFYLGSLYTLYHLVQGNPLGGWGFLLMGLPLASILAFKWHEQQGLPLGEKIIIVLIEGFDAVMNFISNTLSFMRVAAFSLNHAALALAVFAIANGMGLFGHWTTVVLGNLFILVLEGAIVSIQVLRLEYYEGFARFFSGNGRAFRPLHLKNS